MARATLPELDSVTVCVALLDPTFWLANVKLVGFTAPFGAAAPWPVPFSVTDCVLPTLPELSTICRLAVRAPAAAGVNVTATVQVPFTATVLQVFVSVKSAGLVPPITTFETVSGPVPELVTVTVCAVAELPSAVVANVKVVGFAAAAGTPTPVPPSVTVCVVV
jgi:hypothetical protein